MSDNEGPKTEPTIQKAKANCDIPKTEPTIQKAKNNCDIDDAELIDDKVDSSSEE